MDDNFEKFLKISREKEIKTLKENAPRCPCSKQSSPRDKVKMILEYKDKPYCYVCEECGFWYYLCWNCHTRLLAYQIGINKIYSCGKKECNWEYFACSNKGCNYFDIVESEIKPRSSDSIESRNKKYRECQKGLHCKKCAKVFCMGCWQNTGSFEEDDDDEWVCEKCLK